jgi:hypothetical protein
VLDALQREHSLVKTAHPEHSHFKTYTLMVVADSMLALPIQTKQSADGHHHHHVLRSITTAVENAILVLETATK